MPGTLESSSLLSSSSSTTLVVCFSAAAVLWLSFPLVTVSVKCLLASAATQCTRWGPSGGADFHHPLTAAALHLLTVGGLLLFIAIVQVRRPRPIQQNRRRRRSIVVDDDSSFSSSSNDNEEGYEANATSSLSLRDKLRNCAAVGLAFGAKYVVGHWALQLTPSLIYELFHSINILFIALFARLLLNERLTTCEVICCIGIVVGSFTMVGLGGDHEGTKDVMSVAALLLNIANGMLAGGVVVLLRSTMLFTARISSNCAGGVAEVTACKMLIGAAVLLPFAIAMEGSVILSITMKQLAWWWISSVAILMYHVSLSLLCWLASASSVGMIEALRPVPAFVVIALVQRMPHKNVWFWVGSIVTLISAVGFEFSRRFCKMLTFDDGSRSTAMLFLDKRKEKNRRSSESTEATHLLDADFDVTVGDSAATVQCDEEKESLQGAKFSSHQKSLKFAF